MSIVPGYGVAESTHACKNSAVDYLGYRRRERRRSWQLQETAQLAARALDRPSGCLRITMPRLLA